jgi:hypothetical protein
MMAPYQIARSIAADHAILAGKPAWVLTEAILPLAQQPELESTL